MQHQLVEVKAIQIECNCADTQSRKPDKKNFTLSFTFRLWQAVARRNVALPATDFFRQLRQRWDRRF